jgi:hypothetical protein
MARRVNAMGEMEGLIGACHREPMGLMVRAAT